MNIEYFLIKKQNIRYLNIEEETSRLVQYIHHVFSISGRRCSLEIDLKLCIDHKGKINVHVQTKVVEKEKKGKLLHA